MTQGALEPWLGKAKLAEQLHLSVRQVDAMVAKGVPYAVLIGRVKFKLSAVEAWLAQEAPPPTVEANAAMSAEDYDRQLLEELDERELAACRAVEAAGRPCWLYAIQAGKHGHVKLGTATDPQARLADLQTGNAEQLRGLAAWRATSTFDERVLHDRFRDVHVRGEWFLPTAELIQHVRWCGGRFDWKTGKLRPRRASLSAESPHGTGRSWEGC